MSLEALFASPKGGANPVQQLVDHYWKALSIKSILSSYPQDSREYGIATQLDSTKELIEELQKVMAQSPNNTLGLADLESAGLREELEKLEQEGFLQELLNFEFEKAWSKAQEDVVMAEELVREFHAQQEAYKQTPLPLTPSSTKTDSEHSSDEEQSISKRQKTEQDAVAYTSIFDAAQKGDIGAVEYYLTNGVKVDDIDEFGDTILHHAATNGHGDLIQDLLENHKPNINVLDADGNTPLMIAAIFNKEEVVKVLLEHNADTHIANIRGSTPAHAAAANSNLGVLELLKEHGADLKAVNDFGWTVMHSAAKGITTKAEKWEMIKWLLENGVEHEGKDHDGISVSDVFRQKDWSYAEHYKELVGEI